MSNSSPGFDLEALEALTGAKRVLPGLWGQESGPHAVLLYGIEGSGKTTLAKVLARAWLCRNPDATGGCGDCQACRAFAEGLNADVLWVEPGGKSELISIQQITERPSGDRQDNALPIQTFLRTMPLQSRTKVVIIESAHRLTNPAANSLLKTLEEPPEYARFVLTTRFIGQVLPTVHSRCVAIACEIPESDLPSPLSIGEQQQRTAHASTRAKVSGLASRAISGPMGAALSLAEELRGVADAHVESTGIQARVSQAEILKWLSEAFIELRAPDCGRQTIEAHRRVIGNGSFGLVTDALFAEICGQT
jgi:DNA polymerase III delta prime subunit